MRDTRDDYFNQNTYSREWDQMMQSWYWTNDLGDKFYVEGLMDIDDD